jgi:hypothetical protein
MRIGNHRFIRYWAFCFCSMFNVAGADCNCIMAQFFIDVMRLGLLLSTFFPHWLATYSSFRYNSLFEEILRHYGAGKTVQHLRFSE